MTHPASRAISAQDPARFEVRIEADEATAMAAIEGYLGPVSAQSRGYDGDYGQTRVILETSDATQAQTIHETLNFWGHQHTANPRLVGWTNGNWRGDV